MGNPPTRPPKQRESGHYWVHWSYGGGPGKNDVWRIAYYLAKDHSWTVTGDSRRFDESDFLAVGNIPITDLPASLLKTIVWYTVMIAIVFSLLFLAVEVFHILRPCK